VDYIEMGVESYVDERMWNIKIDRNLSGNDLVRVLLRLVFQVEGDLRHAAGEYTAEEVAVVTESATVMALGMFGYDVSGASVPYIANNGDVKTVEKHMKLVEKLVKDVTEKMEG
jgi:hypothetical protein